VSCYVAATTLSEVRKLDSVSEYFVETDIDDLVIREVPEEEELTIDYDDFEVEHTARIWAAIFAFCAPLMICCSEY
jgi:hypothetical protein